MHATWGVPCLAPSSRRGYRSVPAFQAGSHGKRKLVVESLPEPLPPGGSAFLELVFLQLLSSAASKLYCFVFTFVQGKCC